jgi:Nup93/Nic96
MDLDLSEVLAQSRATTARLEATVTKSGADSIPRLERALSQIDRESRRLTPAPASDPSAALRLLSQRGIDTQRIERGLSDAARLVTDAAPAVRVPDAHLDAHLAADHEAAVVDAISAAMARIQQSSLAAVAAARDAEWDAAKRELVALPALQARAARAEPQRAVSSTAPGGVFASPFRAPQVSGGRGGVVAGGDGVGVTPARRAASSASVYEAIVRRAVHARASPTTAVAVATEMDNALVEALAPRGEVSLAPKYVQHLHAIFTALRYMSGEAAPGATLPPTEGAMGGLFAAEDRRSATLGAVRYLSLQFREEKMRRELEARPRDAARGGVPGLIGDVRAYLNLSFDRGVPPQLATGPCVAGLPMWPQVYFCLRAGDPKAALEIVNESLNGGATTSSSVLLFQECLSAYIVSGVRRLLPEGLLSRLVHDYGMSASRGLDNYQRVCYVVICRLDPAAGAKMALTEEDYALLFFSIEDYMWLRLSIVRLDGDPAPPGALAVYGLSLTAIQKEIVAFGPAHFDERGDSPVFYALILLLCGHFAAAVGYLETEARAVAEATHIAFVLYHYGMLRVPEQSAMDTAAHQAACFSVHYDQLLWRYVGPFAAEDPAAAAVYLFTLRDAAVRNEYLEKLILETRAFTLLLGDGPVTAPGRTRGVLEELWPLGGWDATVDGHDWMSMVSSAASMAERRGDRAAAATLHDLTGAMDKVAEIVMDKLSAELTSRGAPARERALTDARNYQERLRQRSASGGGGVRASNVTLRSLDAVVRLAEFFDALWAGGQLERAWALVRGISLLPESDAAIGAKVREAAVGGGAWTAAVCDRVPDVVVGAMECLAGLHATRRRAPDAEPVRNAARVLVNFAGLLPNATADMSARLIRLEVLMS